MTFPGSNDLCTLQDYKQWVNVVNNVNTTFTGPLAAGVRTVTPASMTGITLGMLLSIDILTAQEYVTVLALSSTTFTAVFTLPHAAGAIPITGSVQDAVIARLITSCSAQILGAMGRTTWNESTVTELRNGTGSAVMSLNQPPCQGVVSLTINTIVVPASSNGVVPGYEFDATSIRLVQGCWQPLGYLGVLDGLSFTQFPYGQKNVTVVYDIGPAPGEVAQACIELIQFKNSIGRTKMGLKSESLTVVGATSYVTKSFPDSVQQVIDKYTIRWTQA